MTVLEKAVIIKKLIKKNRLKVDYKTGTVYFFTKDGWKEKRYNLDKDGYKGYTIRFEGKIFFIRGQQLVWVSAGGKIGKNVDIDHRDRNRKNNSLTNLRSMIRGANRGRRL